MSVIASSEYWATALEESQAECERLRAALDAMTTARDELADAAEQHAMPNPIVSKDWYLKHGANRDWIRRIDALRAVGARK